MCRSTAKGGRRCASSHPAVRAARRASARLAQSVAGADAGHPARAAYEQTQVWAARTREAAEAGDDEKAKLYAEQAKQSAAATRGLMTGAPPPSASPPVDPRLAFALGPRPDDPPAGDGWGVPQSPEYPEHVRAAAAFAQASGVGGNATFLPRQDGGQTVAWSDDRFAGAATVYPGSDGEPPYARVVVTRLDQDGYQAWPTRPGPTGWSTATSSTTGFPPIMPSRSSPPRGPVRPAGRGSGTASAAPGTAMSWTTSGPMRSCPSRPPGRRA